MNSFFLLFLKIRMFRELIEVNLSFLYKYISALCFKALRAPFYGHLSCHTKIGPDQFSLLDIYLMHTNKQRTDKPSKSIWIKEQLAPLIPFDFKITEDN